MPKKKEWLPTESDIQEYTLLEELLHALRKEFDILSKKNANTQVNSMKIQIVNRVIEPLNKLFSNEASHKFLELLRGTDFPTNSDVVLIISQYETAITNFKDKYFMPDSEYFDEYGDWKERWSTKENPVVREIEE